MCLRPATPGFLITLAATVCLVVVCFSVPWFKTVYFLSASLAAENITGTVTFGTLGYCLELPGNTTCSSPKIGYQFDPSELNQLLGLDGAIQLPSLFVSWLTYPLVLHLVGLILAAISALFGLLAHVREMAMTCFSTCISGFAATIILIAFIFDLVIFFVAKARLNSVSGGSAAIGNAVWLTLAAWLLLFFAGCAFGFGRCCMSRRARFGPKNIPEPDNSYSQAMRLDAIKAESDRRTRQQTEVGLPSFPAVQDLESRPLTSAKEEPEYLYMKEEEDEAADKPYRDQSPSPGRQQSAADLAAARPVQALDAPYQPIFRPTSSSAQRPYAAGYNPGGQDSGPAYPPDAGYSQRPQDSFYQGYGQSIPSMPQPLPTRGNYGNVHDASTAVYEPHAPYDMPDPGHHVTTSGANPNDYVDPYSRHIHDVYGHYTAGQPESNHAGADPQFVSSSYEHEEQYDPDQTYRSPYLPQPETGFERYSQPIQSIQTPLPMTSPTSPSGPRGPRPPSRGYGRQ